MTIRSIAASLAVASLVLVSGCSKSRNDVSSERDTYDDIGETRVFERESHVATAQPRQQGMIESVPAPAPIVETKTAKPREIAKKVEKAARKSRSSVAAAPERHRVLIGEMDMDE